jgi:hypothetical protein
MRHYSRRLLLALVTLGLLAGSTRPDAVEGQFTILLRSIPEPGFAKSLTDLRMSQLDTSVGLVEINERRGAGSVNTTQPLIAVKRLGDQAVIYICDSKRIFEWLEAKVVDERIDVRSPRGFRVQAMFSGGGASGELTFPNGDIAQFTGLPADGTGSGLFRAQPGSDVIDKDTLVVDGQSVVRGWIVLPETSRIAGAFHKGDCGTAEALLLRFRVKNARSFAAYRGLSAFVAHIC